MNVLSVFGRFLSTVGSGLWSTVLIVSARVKFAFSSSVVQPTPASSVVTNAQPIAESRRVIASPAWTDPMTL